MRRGVGPAFLVLWTGALPVVAAAQATPAPRSAVLSARLTATPALVNANANIQEETSYDVVVTYQINSEGDRLGLSALGLDGVGLRGISVRVDGRLLPDLTWSRTHPTGEETQLWSAEIAALPAEGVHTLELRYTVIAAFHGSEGLTLPVVVPDAQPPPALPGAFKAEVELPDPDGLGMHVRRAFPADVRGGTGPSDRTVSASMPVLPRTLRFTLGPGPAPAWARISLLEALATFLILGLGALGWRHLVRSV